MSSNIGGGGGIRPGQGPAVVDTSSPPASTNAVADAQKAAHKDVEQKRDRNLEQTDAFHAHQETNHVAVSKEELDKAHAAFAQKFAPDVVKFVQQGLNAKIDPYKAMQARALITNSALGKQAIEDVKVALEQSAQALARPPAGLDNAPPLAGAPQLLEAEGLLPGRTSGNAPSSGSLRPGLTPNDPLNPVNKPIDIKSSGDKKPPDKNNANADKSGDKKAATTDANKKLTAQTANDKNAADTKKTDTTPGGTAVQNQKGLPAEKSPGPGETSGAQTPPLGVARGNESSGAETGSGDGGGNGGEAQGNLGGPAGTESPPIWHGGGSQPLSAAGKKATISLNQMQDLLSENAGPETALVVLMAAIEDVDNDLQTAQKMLKARHEVNDAMRQHIDAFNKQTWNMGDNNFEWQRMTYTVGYDKQGNMFVQSFPDVTWQTGTLQEETGKGTSDLTPQQGFELGVGPQGVQEAEGNGSYHMLDGNTCVGLTSYRSINLAEVPAERSYMNSQMSSMKEEDEKWTMNLQNMMDTRKNMLQQFSKIWQSRSDAWAQQIAQIVR